MPTETCKGMHRTGVWARTTGMMFKGLRVNSTVRHSVDFAGDINNDGGCDGVKYADPYGQWDNVLVSGTIMTTLW